MAAKKKTVKSKQNTSVPQPKLYPLSSKKPEQKHKHPFHAVGVMKTKQEIKLKQNEKLSPLIQHYGESLSKCISITSASESSDTLYAIKQVDRQLRIMGLRVTIKIGIEKINLMLRINS